MSLAVLLRQVAALVEVGQRHHVPADVDVADLLDLEHPAGRHPGPRADRVEPEVGDGRRSFSGRSGCGGHDRGQPLVTPGAFPVGGRRALRARILRRPLSERDLSVLSAAARMNVTRDEAQARARLLVGRVLRRRRSTSPRARSTFRSTTTARFRCTEPGATHVHRPRRATRSTRSRSTAGRSTRSRRTTARASRSTTWRADNELRVARDCRYMHTGEGLHRFVDPVDKSVYLYTQFEVADSRRMFTVFEQPDLKATFAFTVHRARRLAGRLQPADARAGAGRPRQRDLAVRADRAACRRTSRRWSPGPTTAIDERVPRRRPGHPARRCTAARRWPSTSTPT